MCLRSLIGITLSDLFVQYLARAYMRAQVYGSGAISGGMGACYADRVDPLHC